MTTPPAERDGVEVVDINERHFADWLQGKGDDGFAWAPERREIVAEYGRYCCQLGRDEFRAGNAQGQADERARAAAKDQRIAELERQLGEAKNIMLTFIDIADGIKKAQP